MFTIFAHGWNRLVVENSDAFLFLSTVAASPSLPLDKCFVQGKGVQCEHTVDYEQANRNVKIS